MCVSVCLCVRQDISGTTRAIFTNFCCACCLWPWLGLSVAGLRNPKDRGSFGGFLPVDYALYSIAFGTHTKTAEPIEMPFGIGYRP